MEPLSAGILALGGGLTQGFAGGQQQYHNPSNALYVTSPYQQLLQHQMQRRAMAGNLGDTGLAGYGKQGKGQLQQMMARSGISPQSGAYAAGLSNMLGQAQGMDSQNRYGQLMGMASMSPAVAQGDAHQGRHNMWQMDPTGQFTGNTQPANYMYNRQL